jgi:DNA invertase Pin-like site-specific DNA recombinase
MNATPSANALPVAILVRVSTVRQETSRQITELRAHAEAKGWNVVAVCGAFAVSGRADESERHGLHDVEELARAGKIKKVLVHEVSRLARRNSIVHKFVETLEELGVSLYWHAQGVETLLPSGKRNPSAAVMLALLAEMARNETETLRTRIMSRLEEARRKGSTSRHRLRCQAAHGGARGHREAPESRLQHPQDGQAGHAQGRQPQREAQGCIHRAAGRSGHEGGGGRELKERRGSIEAAAGENGRKINARRNQPEGM